MQTAQIRLLRRLNLEKLYDFRLGKEVEDDLVGEFEQGAATFAARSELKYLELTGIHGIL